VRSIILVCALVIPGVVIASVCIYFALMDYSALCEGYRQFQAVANSQAGLRAVFVAYAGQDVHRINLFAEGVWALLGFLLMGIGIHGLCIRTTRS